MKILNMGPDNAAALRIARALESTLPVAVPNAGEARSMRAAQVPNLNPVVTGFTQQPFKSSTFDMIYSYHTLNYIIPADIPQLFKETIRMLKENSWFTFLIWSLKPANEAQSSHLKLLEILEKLGLVYLPGFDNVSLWLEAAGFEEITMELVMSNLTVPDDWVRLHVKRLEELQTERHVDIGEALESYRTHVNEYGEELMPSIQFTARRGESLSCIDIVK